MLTDSEKKLLLSIARSAIKAELQGIPVSIPKNIPESLRTHSGAFVTLHQYDELRGCIGYIESNNELIDTIIEVAQKSAFEDPRFQPVVLEEEPELEFEISVLTPARQITDVSEIIVGTHGIIMQKGMRRGLLLPQVPLEYGWDRETFLNQTARKAGLPIKAWQEPDTKIFIFSAEVFNEHEFR